MLMCGTGSLHVIEPESALNAKITHTGKQGPIYHLHRTCVHPGINTLPKITPVFERAVLFLGLKKKTIF